MRAGQQSVHARFENQANALNALRLALAVTVVVWHAHLLLGSPLWPWPVWQLMEELPVDAFFAISGFLITRSWSRRPHAGAFLAARAARLLPGLWVCLAFTAFVVAPVANAMSGGTRLPLSAEAHYLLGNAAIVVTTPGIAGTPDASPIAVWNLSLWSLWWEAWCYLAVLLLGLVGWLRVRIVLVIAAVSWALSLSFALIGVPRHTLGTLYLLAIPRLALMFACGALLWLLAERVPVSRLAAGACVIVIAVAAWTPNYRLLAAPALAYLCVWIGLALGAVSWLRLRNDLSYGVYLYGAPVEQALLMAGFLGSWLAFTGLALVFVLPVAGASWFLAERPVMRAVRSRSLSGWTFGQEVRP